MAEQAGNHQYPEFAHGGKAKYQAAYQATIFTAISALVLILVLWFYTPDYVVLIKNPDASTLAQVSTELQKSNIAYQYDSESGSVLVPERFLYHARFVLGSKGVEQSTMSQLLPENDYNGPSKRSNRRDGTVYFALESELARTISSINDIQWARVHLSIQSEQTSSTENNSRASVFVKLAPGRALVESQLTSISHLVAASVPHLSVRNVTIIDQAGNLLKSTGDDKAATDSSMRFSYTRMLEQSYINKIESLLEPIFGKSSIRVRVEADVNFQDTPQVANQPGDMQVTHELKKLSATVVVDNKHVSNESGQMVSIPRTKKELDKIEILVKDSIGLNEQRGDRVNVFNETFSLFEGRREESGFFTGKGKIYERKEFLLVIPGILLIYFILTTLLNKRKRVNKNPIIHSSSAEMTDQHVLIADEHMKEGAKNNLNEKSGISDVKNAYEVMLSQVRQLVDENPTHVARVLRTWVRDNGR